MKILVSGAQGQLGNALQNLKSRAQIVALNRLEFDITNQKQVAQVIVHEKPDVLINAAAFTNVDGAETQAEEAYRINREAPGFLAQICSENNVKLVHISTDYVFDGLLGRPYHEKDATRPLSVYGKSKREGEVAVIKIDLQHLVVRTAWVYHWHGKNFLKTMYGQINKPLVRVVNDQFGSPTFAPHLALGLLQLIEKNVSGVYHLAGHGVTTWFDLTKTFYELMGIKTEVHPVTTKEFPRPAFRPPYSALTTVRTEEICLPPWEQGLEEFVKGFNNPSFPNVSIGNPG
ncbi:MAG: dTDP-4-dehydrorhamnose reductase [Elusimicrobiota bacterium]